MHSLAVLSALTVANTAYEIEEAAYYADLLLRLDVQRKQVIVKMASWQTNCRTTTTLF
ncbi:hypothetical protein [Lactobacillus xylocopicola]|uniref:hypothetical protein n=1 Tax=Lactobacillus xylocopicola TaxID=2976676 RepID=UPI002953B861|nr:hypothetical protein [Lactobacillus xylocopicola]